jgi:hypothetical protein
MKKAALLGFATVFSLFANAATVEYWNFENSTYTGGAPTDNLWFTDTTRGDATGQHGTLGINSTLGRGYNQTYGPRFDADDLSGPNAGRFTMDTVDNSGDMYVNSGAIHSWTSPNWTLECHVKFRELTGWHTIAGRDGTSWGSAESDFYFQRMGVAPNALRLNYSDVDGTRHVLDGTQTLATGRWYAFAVVANTTAGTLTMYIDTGDGYKQESQITGLSENLGITSSTLTWTFMRGWYSSYQTDHVSGLLDNVRFSNTALSIHQLTSLHGSTGPVLSLIAVTPE